MLNIMLGDILSSECSTLVNTVNCVGVMGKGIAANYKKQFPEMFKDYAERCNKGLVKPGEPYAYYDFLSGKTIINFPTKNHWRSPSKLSYIICGLNWFIDNYEKLQIDSVAFPPLGCGNGGLEWSLVGPLMVSKLEDLPIRVDIYAPYGTNKSLLDIENLKKLNSTTEEYIGKKYLGYNRNWNMLLYVIQELNNDSYSLHVGRTIYQKICYILTISGIDTGFHFVKSSYGPFSSEAKNALTILSNNNLINEGSNGSMIEINVDKSFKYNPQMFNDIEIEKMNKALDLLYRIKNTESSEVIASILFAYNELKRKSSSVEEDALLTYLTEWKKRWNNQEYINKLRTYIVELTWMGWMKPVISKDTYQLLDEMY